MHPCCWGNLFQGLLQFAPVLAIFAVASKKMWNLRWRLKSRASSPLTPSCCAGKSHVDSVVDSVVIEKN
jgi:hypothetical protein